MCGICCIIRIHPANQTVSDGILLENTKTYESLRRRGPDCCNSIRRTLYHEKGYSCQVDGLFCGSVLHQRGKLTPQPLQDDGGNILSWNGEIFAGIEVKPDDNDGKVLLSLLSSCTTDAEILVLLSRIRGPWSFVYWQESKKQLWFGRDVFGRRSLLWQWQQDSSNFGGTLTVSSVGSRPANDSGVWEEIPARGMYCIPMQRWSGINSESHFLDLVLYPWQQGSLYPSEQNELIGANSQENTGIVRSDEANKLQMEHEDAPAKISKCDGITGSPLRITMSVLGIRTPIVPLNKAIPGDKDSVLWQTSMEEIRADKSVTERLGAIRVGETQHEDSPLSNPANGSEVSLGLNQVKPGTNLHEQISLDHRTRDLFVKLEGQLHKHAKELIDVLGDAVCRRVHNLPRPLSVASSRDSGDKRTEHHGDCDIPIKLGDDPCKLSDDNPVVVDFKADLKAITTCKNDDQNKANSCPSQKGIPRPPVAMPEATAPTSPSYPDISSCANHTSSTSQEQLHLESSKPQPDRCTGESSQTGSDLGCYGDTKYCRVAILFSGGIDSMVLAVLADRYVPKDEPIDLLNVAFQQVIKPNTTKGKMKKKHDPKTRQDKQEIQYTYEVPDRITGRSGLQELKQINPHRQWNFVEINVTLDELRTMRSERVSDLVYPLQSVLDDSIGCAIWFAARGRGHLVTSEGPDHLKTREDAVEISGGVTSDAASLHDQKVTGESTRGGIMPCQDIYRELYTSPAKVVLVGMGADEQLAGYSRHRGKFNAGGWEGLVEEMEMEVQRISSRNLGRDDRIISDHGRESRLPYLDEEVVNFLQQLPVWNKTDLSLPRGVGEKMLLRVAARQLGMTDSALLPKRAIQFGSKIAKMEKSNEKASDVCGRLK